MESNKATYNLKDMVINYNLYLTNFPKLDQALEGGLSTGLTVVAGEIPPNNTIFSLQLADNIAKQGNIVMYFSLYEFKDDLIKKSISRFAFEEALSRQELTDDTKTASEITLSTISDTDIMRQATTNYSVIAENIYMYDKIRDLRAEIATVAELTNQKPVIFIDNLDILKIHTDINELQLKWLATELNIAIIVTSLSPVQVANVHIQATYLKSLDNDTQLVSIDTYGKTVMESYNHKFIVSKPHNTFIEL